MRSSCPGPSFAVSDWNGWNGYTCTRSEDLRGVLGASFEVDGPSLVVIPIDYRENRLLTQKLGEITATL